MSRNDASHPRIVAGTPAPAASAHPVPPLGAQQLSTALVGLFLSDSSAALQAKMGQLPPELMGFFEQLPIVGTPEEAVPRIRSLIEAGFQYVFFIILPFDRETLQLTGERVISALRAG